MSSFLSARFRPPRVPKYSTACARATPIVPHSFQCAPEEQTSIQSLYNIILSFRATTPLPFHTTLRYGRLRSQWRPTRAIPPRAMVLRNAALHTILDDCDGGRISSCPMQSSQPIPTFLHLSCRLLQITGMPLSLTYWPPFPLTSASTGVSSPPSSTLAHRHWTSSSTSSS